MSYKADAVITGISLKTKKMKKKIIGSFAVLAIVAYNVYFNNEKEQLSALALANIEALASGESSYNSCYYRIGGCVLIQGSYIFSSLSHYPR